jgi:HK97 family phage major capsid protein
VLHLPQSFPYLDGFQHLALCLVQALGLVPVVASGNVLGGGNGANSLGVADFVAAYAALNSAYLQSPKVAWAMSHTTLAYLLGLVSTTGQPMNLVQYVDGQATIFGVPVKIAPSMDSIGASQTPVVLGAFDYWCTRLVVDSTSGIAIYREAPGLIENGNIGMRAFIRADGCVLYSDTGSPAPFVMLQNCS